MFSANPSTRGAYQSLFRLRKIEKTYEAIAPPLLGRAFPFVHRTRIVPGEPFFRMQEVEGVANSETLVDVIERGADRWRYKLMPVTGRTHQLRVQMAGLGIGIEGDRMYPVLMDSNNLEMDVCLRLVAKQLAFEDPVSGLSREFRSRQELAELLVELN